MQIGELARRAGVNAKTVRFYEEIGLLHEPRRSPSGYRIYTEDQLRKVQFILSAKRLGLSLDEIADIIRLREGGQPPCFHVESLLRQRLEELRRVQGELRQMESDLRTTLKRTRERLAEIGTADYCPVIEHSRVSLAPLPLAERALKRRPSR